MFKRLLESSLWIEKFMKKGFHSYIMEQTANLRNIEEFLLKFKGGEVTLSKDYWNEGIAMLCLNHPEKRNAMSGKMMVDLSKCVSTLENWESGKAVIIYGAGENFCSGGDLDFAKATGTAKEGFYMSCYMQDTLKRFRKLPLVSVTLVHGPALGGGAEMSVFSDYILVTDNVKLGFVHGKMGIVTAWGGGTRLVQILGERKAIDMLLSSKVYNAKECLELGIAHKILDTANRTQETLNFVRTLTGSHSSIVQSFKKIVNKAAEADFATSLSFECEEFAPKWGSDLNREALQKRIHHVKEMKL